jgi:hypothetical protein
VVGLAIVEALDDVHAPRDAEAAGIHCPGVPATVDRLDPASVAAGLLWRRLDLGDLVGSRSRRRGRCGAA